MIGLEIVVCAFAFFRMYVFVRVQALRHFGSKGLGLKWQIIEFVATVQKIFRHKNP